MEKCEYFIDDGGKELDGTCKRKFTFEAVKWKFEEVFKILNGNFVKLLGANQV